MTDTPIRTAMVLAAGFGTRLRPLTEHVPKPLVPLGGGRLLDWILSSLASAGVERVAVNTHHLAEQVEDYLRDHDYGLDVTVFRETEILGTGGALANARSVLARDERILLVNGDVLCDPDFDALAGAAPEAEATLLLKDVPRINTVRLGADGGIRDVAGLLAADPALGDRMLTYTGVAVLSRTFLERLPEGRSELAAAFCAALRDDPASIRGLDLGAGTWHDLGTPARYLEAEAGLHTGEERVVCGPDVSVAPGVHLKGFVHLYQGCRVDDDVELDDCIVMPGVRVKGPASHHRTVIGDGWTMPARPPVPDAPSAELVPLLAEAGLTSDTTAEPLTGQASDRLFWRVRGGGASVVVMDARDDAVDFDRFTSIAGFLAEQGLGGPRILAVDAARPALVMEDFGDASLGRLLADPTAPDPMDAVFARLLDLQIRGTALAEGGACPHLLDRDFGTEDLTFETGYFARRFLLDVCGLEVDDVMPIVDECRALADAVARQPRVLMHRDFQSTNILLQDGEVQLVDVQGMRRGPRGYDPASLIRDPYLDPDPGRVVELRDRWVAAASERHGAEADVLHREVILAGLQRNMQALGAYGFLTHIRGKRAYRRWILPGLRQLAAGFDDAAVLADAPDLTRLRTMVHRLEEARERLDLDRQ